MLGTPGSPSLLVDIEQEYNPTHFDFWVVNGAWKGTYTNGHVTVWHWEPWSELSKTEILCDSPDRLRGGYQEVFDNFNNLDYVAPAPKQLILPEDWDDDIAF